jgi:hypothetical protein
MLAVHAGRFPDPHFLYHYAWMSRARGLEVPVAALLGLHDARCTENTTRRAGD